MCSLSLRPLITISRAGSMPVRSAIIASVSPPRTMYIASYAALAAASSAALRLARAVGPLPGRGGVTAATTAAPEERSSEAPLGRGGARLHRGEHQRGDVALRRVR